MTIAYEPLWNEEQFRAISKYDLEVDLSATETRLIPTLMTPLEYADYLIENGIREGECIMPSVTTITYKGVKHSTYRYIYACLKGPIPRRKVVMHSCDNNPCINPNHLDIGTQSQNIKDSRMRWKR